MGGHLVKYAPSRRFRPYVKKVMACGHWEDAEDCTGNDKAILRHVVTGLTVAYHLHDGGNDQNAPRNFAADAGAICGCSFIEHRNRRRSRNRVVMYDDERQRAAAKRRGDEAERAAHINDLREACQYASAACQRDPSNLQLRRHYDRLRVQLAQALKESA